MRQYARQQGLSFWGYLLVVGLVVFFALVGVKLFPLYYDDFKVSAALKSLQQEPSAASSTDTQLREMLLKRLDIDNVKHITKDDIEIQRQGDKFVVSIDYEARENLFGNLDVVAVFQNSSGEVTRN